MLVLAVTLVRLGTSPNEFFVAVTVVGLGRFRRKERVLNPPGNELLSYSNGLQNPRPSGTNTLSQARSNKTKTTSLMGCASTFVCVGAPAHFAPSERHRKAAQPPTRLHAGAKALSIDRVHGPSRKSSGADGSYPGARAPPVGARAINTGGSDHAVVAIRMKECSNRRRIPTRRVSSSGNQPTGQGWRLSRCSPKQRVSSGNSKRSLSECAPTWVRLGVLTATNHTVPEGFVCRWQYWASCSDH